MDNGWRGEVIHIDHFGNIGSNIRVENLGEAMKHKEDILVHIKGSDIKGLVNTFGDRPIGELIALLGSTGNLAISVVNGSAVHRLDAKIGDTVEVVLKS
jgi:S-adenosylmethionine hydrolase